MKRTVISAFLVLFVISALAQSTSQVPGINEYQVLDQEARVLNLDRIKRKIRVPVSALKEQRILKIHCRILVNAQGNYVRHVFTRIDHEELLGPVSIQIANLSFLPARRDHENVSSWVNVIFRFAPKRESLQQHGSFRESLFSGFHRNQISQEAMDMIRTQLEQGRWEEGISHTSVLIEDHHRLLRKHHPEQLIDLYTARAMALLGTGMPELAHIDLNKAMCLQAESELNDLPPSIHALRILSGLATNHLDTQVEDFRWIQSNMNHHDRWTVWFPVLLSSKYRATLSPQALDQASTNPESEEIFTIVRGLNALDRHEFDSALIWMSQATLFGLPQPYQRELSLRMAESLRQTNQQEDALNICQELLESQPLDPFTHYMKGVILLDIGATEAGNEALQYAIQLGLAGENKSKAISLLEPTVH